MNVRSSIPLPTSYPLPAYIHARMPLLSAVHPGGSGYGFKTVQNTLGNYQKIKKIRNNPKNLHLKDFCNILNVSFFSGYCDTCDTIRSNKLSWVLRNSLFHSCHRIQTFNETCQHTNIHCWKLWIFFPSISCSRKLFKKILLNIAIFLF